MGHTEFLRAAKKSPYLVEYVNEFLNRDNEERAMSQCLDYDIGQIVSAKNPELGRALTAVIQECKANLWADEHREQLLSAIEKIEDTRLLDFMQNEKLGRAHDDLRRMISRAWLKYGNTKVGSMPN